MITAKTNVKEATSVLDRFTLKGNKAVAECGADVVIAFGTIGKSGAVLRTAF